MFPLTHAAYRLLGKGTMQNYEINFENEKIKTEKSKIGVLKKVTKPSFKKSDSSKSLIIKANF